MAGDQPNSLLSTHKSSDSGLQVHLHPLALLTISDYITRHTVQRRNGAVVGALLGQQNGRVISLEHAFECDVFEGDYDNLTLEEDWFNQRLVQYKEVYKSPAIDLVGWFTVIPTTGPEAQHLPMHKQILKMYNETAILLAFHPSGVLQGAAVGGKLPLSIYESVHESIKSDGQTVGDDGEMEIEGQEVSQDSQLDLRFRELPYSVETGEAEMISVDFVARGSGNAMALDGNTKNITSQASQTSSGELDLKTTAKQTDKQNEARITSDSSMLSAEDEEFIASLTARANAVKMLHTRLQLLKSYLTNLPPSYLTTSAPANASPSPASADHTEINHPILRSIQALINRLPLLLPANQAAFEQERLAEKSDVSLVDLLGNLSRSVKETREMGRKFWVVDTARQNASRRQGSNMIATDEIVPFSPTEKAEASFGYAI